jgi:hypothetical protein
MLEEIKKIEEKSVGLRGEAELRRDYEREFGAKEEKREELGEVEKEKKVKKKSIH